MMEYKTWTVWGIVVRFLIGWIVVGGLLVVYSCIKYRTFIASVLADNMLACFNAVMPVVIILIWVIFYLIKSVFR